MKINKRVFYALSSLLILGYSVLSPLNSVFAQGSTPQIPDFRITKKLLLQYDKSSVDVSTLFYSYFFTRKDVEWPYSCSRFISRADAEKSYKKAVYGNGDWIVLNHYYGGNDHDERYVRLYWTESKAPKQILRYDEYYGYYFSEYGFKQLILTMSSSGHFRVVCGASLVGDNTPLVLSSSYSKPPGLLRLSCLLLIMN